MRANQARWPIATMARLLGVSTSGYYAWLVREPSRRSRSDAQLLTRIRTLHASSRGTYGAPRIHAQLAREGVHVGRKRVARLMRIADLREQADGAGHVQRASVRGHGVRRTSCAGTSMLKGPTYCGSQMPPTFRQQKAFSIWPWCLMSSAGASSAGRCRTTCTPN